MATYTELAGYVSDWANRDLTVLNYDTIRQCIKYAHDECYRTLRIAPLEVTRTGTIAQRNVDDGFLVVNSDLVEFIQLRKLSTNDATNYSPFNKPYIVAEAHSDARSFRGDSVTLYSDYAFYREGTEIYIYPQFKVGEEWQMYYYRRLPEANERFDIDEVLLERDVNGELIVDEDGNIERKNFDRYFELDTAIDADDRAADTSIPDTGMTAAQLGLTITYPVPNPDGEYDADDTFTGVLKTQWLRDENEKALLFGALYQAFDYLDEPEQTGKYRGKFEQEIHKLNQEDMMRMNSGGNVNINFYNRLI